ncbi:hypothetical protein G6F65_016613 [Rhizopus arrhizus]|nr:hypothetical protein G6F65_016613 [Rhizopus arrhizus]
MPRLGDAQAAARGLRQQLVAALERVGQRRLVGHDAVIGRVVLVDHEAATNGVVIAGGDHFVVGVVRGEAHAVGVVRQLLALVHAEVALLVEGDLVLPHQLDALAAADALQGGRDDVRVDQVRPLAFQAEQDRLVGAVAAAGQRQRAIDIGADARDLVQAARVEQPAMDESLGGLHRPDGVRGTRTNADLENVERADSHGCQTAGTGQAAILAACRAIRWLRRSISATGAEPVLTLIQRDDCHLCDLALAELAKARAPEFESVFLDDQPALETRYGARVPVLRDEAGQRELDWP